MKRNKSAFLLSATLCVVALFQFLSAAEPEVIKVKLEDDETLRTLAKKYFNEPNDWEVILFYNGFKSPNDVNSGVTLTIPIGLYWSIVQKLETSQVKINEANTEGAGILAKEELQSAIELQKEAVELKKKGQLDQSLKLFESSIQNSEKAIRQTKQKRIKSITAVLSEKRGKVQSRTPVQTIWNDAEKNQELIEKERIRTLPSAHGEISFIDGSTLNLGENSMAIIEAMKQDLVKNTNSSSVVLLQGDVMAYLSGQGKKSNVNINTPGVETEIRSRNFRASLDANQTARYANYDGEIDVKSAGGKVTVKKNEGTTIIGSEKPSQPKELLPPPEIISPKSKERIFNTAVTIIWQPFVNAVAYKVEVSKNRSFSEIVCDTVVQREIKYLWRASETGMYFVRVSSVDKDRLVGLYSTINEFYLDKDTTPPFLLVETPKENETFFNEEIKVTGQVENGVTVTVNGEKTIIKDGKFSNVYKLKEGNQTIIIVGKDEAGNVTEIKRNVIYDSSDQVVFLDGETSRKVSSLEFTITGNVKPMSKLELSGQSVPLINNQFNIILNLKDGANQFTLKGVSSKGKVQIIPIQILVDRVPPTINLDDQPSFTNQTSAVITGTLSETANLTINGKIVLKEQNQFKSTIDLIEGENSVVLIAVDETGNQTVNQIEIIRDTKSPEVLSAKLSVTDVKGGELVKIVVGTKDTGVGLSRNGKFWVEITPGGKTLQGMLNLSSGGTEYLGNVVIPPLVKGKLKIKEVRISDYLGNETKYP